MKNSRERPSRRKKMFTKSSQTLISRLSAQTDLVQNKTRAADGFQRLLSWATNVTEEQKLIVLEAAQILVDLFTNPITHLVIVGTMSSGLGESSTPLVLLNNYTTLRSDYPGTNNTFRESILQNNMPASDP